MSQKFGLTEDGFARIAQAAERQRQRGAATTAALQPAIVRYASLTEVARDFYKGKDGKVMDRQAHRVWEMKAQPGGGFELIRAQDESIEEPAEGLDDEMAPVAPKPMSARLMKAASRGARYHAQMAPTIPGVPEEEVEAQAPAEMPPVAPTAQAPAEMPPVSPMPAQAPGEEEELPELEGQAPAEMPPVMPAQAPAMPPAAPIPTTAGIRDIAETREDRRLAGLTRGTKVLVRIGRRDVMRGKVLRRTATHFDILLENGATTRARHQDVAPDAPAPRARTVGTTINKRAVDEKAKSYWEAYFKEYGRQLVKSDLPRAVTDRAEPATPAGKQKTPTKSAAKATVGDVVDIGNIWMASKGLRTGIVRIVKAGADRLAVQDPFGGKMVVPRKAVVVVRDPGDFSAARKGGVRLNRARIIQAASAALTWDQIDARYPKAVDKIRLARRWMAVGMRIALAKGATPATSQAGVFGRAAAAADWQPNLRKRALDELGKSYYKAYFGDYGEDLVKEVRRRVKADIIDRQIGRVAARRPAPRAARPAPPAPRLSMQASIANALTAHVGGIMRQGGAKGRYSVDPRTVAVTSSTRERNRRVLSGKFTGKFVGPDKQAVARKSFEMIVEAGKVKAIKIST